MTTNHPNSHGFSYWDAQLWACARLHHTRLVLSEDFTDGQVIEGVRFVDPFRPAFDVSVFD
jgi:predicted nucleic acid-binding protein